MNKIKRRIRKKRRLRKRLVGMDHKPRVCIFRSSLYTYAQVVSDEGQRTLVSASTRESVVKDRAQGIDKDALHSDARSSKSVAAARGVGLVLAERLKEKGVEEIVFDRNGFVYHGRVRAVADGMRAGGVKC